MEGKLFFCGSEVERKSIEGVSLRINSWTFFFPALHSGEALVYLCSIQLFAEASSWDFFLLSCVGGCVFLPKIHGRPTGAFFRNRQCPWSVWWVCCCLCWVPWSPNLKRTKSARYMMWLPTIVLEIWGFPKKQKHPAIGHVAFGMGVLLVTYEAIAVAIVRKTAPLERFLHGKWGRAIRRLADLKGLGRHACHALGCEFPKNKWYYP